MRLLALTALLLSAAACSPTTETDATNPPIATEEATAQREAAAPAAGANSFTEEGARERIAAKGYTNPTALTQAADGNWQGQATQDGKTINVAVDYRGNVVTNNTMTTP